MRCSTLKLILVVVLGLLSGCSGSGSNSAVGDPLAKNQEAPQDQTPTGTGTVLGYSMSLTTAGTSGGTTVGSNATVIARATLKDSNGNVVGGQPIRFEEITTPPDNTSSVTIPVSVVDTSSEGVATTFLTTLDPSVNKDVIIRAVTSINGQVISAISTFKIVRSTGNYINFITTKEPTDPDGNLNRLTADVTAIDPLVVPAHGILQLVTFEVLDKNGLDRTHVPVKLEIFHTFGDCTVHLDRTGLQTETITTDDTGTGLFSAEVVIPTPPIGSQNSCSVIYKATTADPYATTPTDLFSYGGYMVVLRNNLP